MIEINFRTACLLSSVRLSNSELQEAEENISHVCRSEDTQQLFFEYCRRWKLAPVIFMHCRKYKLLDKFSKGVQDQFEEQYNKVLQQNRLRNSVARKFLQQFKEENIEVIILKGNAFASTVYGDIGYKKMNDFDILIHRGDWDRIQQIYLRLGFIPLGFGWSGEKEKAAKFSHVGMSFISPDLHCIVGSQWGLKSPTAGYAVDIDEAWRTSLPFQFEGIEVRQLSPSFNLLHLILHMGIYKCGIRDCMDVYNLLLMHKPDIKTAASLIQKTGAAEKAAFTITLADICMPGINELTPHLRVNNSSFIMRRLHKRILVQQKTGDFQCSYNDYFQDIEKTVIYFNLFPVFHKRIYLFGRLLRMLFIPKAEIAFKLSDCYPFGTGVQKLMARIKAPGYTFSLIAQEIGWKFTILLFLKLFFDTLFSIKNYIFKSESYFDYLRKRGIDPKAIEHAIKNIE